MRLDRRIIAACAVGLLACSSPVFADDAKPATPAASGQTTQAAPAAPTAPATQPAVAAPAVATPHVPDAVQAWAKFCDPAPNGHKVCIVRKLVFQGTTIMASFVIRIDSGKGVPTLAVAAVPVGVVLRPGLMWQLDKQKPMVLPYWRCTPQTCESELLIKPDFINRMKSGTALTLTAKNVEGKNLVMKVSLSGFGAVFDKQNAPTFAEYSKSLAQAH